MFWALSTISSLSLPFFLTVFVLDPMGEEHYTRGASWIPAFMVVVGPMCFPSFAHRAYYKSRLPDCVRLSVCKLVQVGRNFSEVFFCFIIYAQTSHNVVCCVLRSFLYSRWEIMLMTQ